MSTIKSNISVNDVIDRAKIAFDARSDAHLSEILGVSPTNVSSWRKRDVVPYEYLYFSCRRYNISLDWVILGEGTMKHGVRDDSLSYYSGGIENFEQVNLYAVDASAGHGSAVISEDFKLLYFRKEWFSNRGLTAKNLIAVNVVGDSMAPDIPNDSVVLVDSTQIEIKDGGVYVFNLQGDLLIKRVMREFDQLRAISINKEYPDIFISSEKVENLKIVGRVVRALPDIKL